MKDVALKLITEWVKFTISQLKRIIALWSLIVWFIKIKIDNNFFINISISSLFYLGYVQLLLAYKRSWDFSNKKYKHSVWSRNIQLDQRLPVWCDKKNSQISNFPLLQFKYFLRPKHMQDFLCAQRWHGGRSEQRQLWAIRKLLSTNI